MLSTRAACQRLQQSLKTLLWVMQAYGPRTRTSTYKPAGAGASAELLLVRQCRTAKLSHVADASDRRSRTGTGQITESNWTAPQQ
jgi:hypothetical protein